MEGYVQELTGKRDCNKQWEGAIRCWKTRDALRKNKRQKVTPSENRRGAGSSLSHGEVVWRGEGGRSKQINVHDGSLPDCFLVPPALKVNTPLWKIMIEGRGKEAEN